MLTATCEVATLLSLHFVEKETEVQKKRGVNVAGKAGLGFHLGSLAPEYIH